MSIMTNNTGRRVTTKLGAHIVIVVSLATAPSACAVSQSDLPTISPSEVASGQPLPEGILPNGRIFEPYNN
jgi:hypothetical protein